VIARLAGWTVSRSVGFNQWMADFPMSYQSIVIRPVARTRSDHATPRFAAQRDEFMEYWATELAQLDSERPGLLLVDPHDFTRQCMSELLGEHAVGWDVWASASLEEDIPERRPHLILLRLDGRVATSGELPDLIAHAVRIHAGVPIALLCSLSDLDDAFATMRLGIRGYLSASLSVEQVIAALRLVMAGGVYVAPCTGPDIPCRAPEPEGEATILDASLGSGPSLEPVPAGGGDNWPLTPREEDVRFHLRQGKPNKVIAYELGMSENTVKVHVSRILRKLNVMNRTALACMDDERGHLSARLPQRGVSPGGSGIQGLRNPS